MMKVEQRSPVPGPGHPVGDGPHLDRGQHGLAQPALVEQGFERPHRRIMPHVLVDLEHHPGPLARVDQARRFRVGQGHRLLRQDAADPTGVRQHPADHPRLLGRRHGDVHDLDRRVVEHLLERVVDLRHAPQRGHLFRRRDRPRGDADHAIRGLGVGHQVTVADDEARAHHADADVAPLRSLRSMIQVPTGRCLVPFQFALASLGREKRPLIW